MRRFPLAELFETGAYFPPQPLLLVDCLPPTHFEPLRAGVRQARRVRITREAVYTQKHINLPTTPLRYDIKTKDEASNEVDELEPEQDAGDADVLTMVMTSTGYVQVKTKP